MVVRLLTRASLSAVLAGALFAAWAVPHAHGQCETIPPPHYHPPSPCLPSPAAPVPGLPPGAVPPATPESQLPPAPDLGAAQAAAGTGGEVALAAPNMLGHLLYGSRSVSFRYSRAAGPVNVSNFGSTSIVNPAVADDNSPLPLDRIGFRFNFFDSAQQVTGFGAPVFDARGVGTAFPRTKNYNVEAYTFNAEKTFLDGFGSVELRVPFSTGLSSNLDLSAGQVTGPGPNGSLAVSPTPQRTLGTDGTQFGNMTLILKGLAYSGDALTLSAGVALGIPSGDDTTVTVTDYAGPSVLPLPTIQRVRTIHIDNETWSLSPFVAFLSTPTERFFTQGFLQFDFPLNDSTINYSNVYTRGTPPPPLPAVLLTNPTLTPPFAVRGGIQEQPLMQVDLGTGYWVVRDPSRRWITGLAPSLELHYTTTLKDASVVTLPADTLLQINPNNPRRLIQEQPPQVGNQRNRMDILDMTVGLTFLVSDRATVATGFAFPLRGGDNRTFDWEYLLQVNYYFGGGASTRRFAPSF